MKKILLLFLSIMTTFELLIAQDIRVTGTVSADDGETLPGVSILIKGSTVGVVTDIDGNYSLNVPSDQSVLTYSYVGFLTSEETIGGRSVIDVALNLDVAQLDEIIVVGYGTQKKINSTGAVSSITAKDMEARPLTSAATALQGAAPGVFVNQNSGQPGRDDVSIRIRGVGTLNDANPLILIDGIEAPISNLNPDDIESITVLKDAASASIYGSRAANGVVLVTTKRGTGKAGVTFNYNGYYGTTSAIRLPDIVDNAALYATMWNEANTNFGETPKYSDAQIADFEANGPDNNWFKSMFNSAPITQHNFSASGSSDKTNFRYSFGYLNQDGVLPKAAFKRFNTRLNLDTKVNDRVTIGVNLAITRGDRDGHQEEVSGAADGSIIANMSRSQPVDQMFNADGVLVRPIHGVNNAWINMASRNFNRKENDILGSTYIEVEVMDGLKVKGTAAINYRDYFDSRVGVTVPTADPLTNVVTSGPSTNRTAQRNAFNKINLTTWLQTTYEKTIGKNFFKILAGFNQETSETEAFEARRTTFISNNILTLNAGDPSTASNNESATQWALRSYFGRVNYVLDEKYLFEANVRYDGSSRFQNEKWGVFPAFSAGWIISEEGFFNSPFMDVLKLRGSWGQLGNQNIGDFRYTRSLDLSQNYTFGGGIVQGVAQTNLGNPELRWEKTASTNLGINMEMFNSKLQIEADYFVRTTEDILFDIPVASISGFTSQILNSAELRNKGWELTTSYRENFGDFSFRVSANVTHVTNEVLKLNKTLGNDEVDQLISGGSAGSSILKPGAPINAYYGYKDTGIFRSQAEFEAAADHSILNSLYGVGDVGLQDLSGDGVIGPEDRQVIGNPDPKWIYGMNLDFGYKGIGLAILLQGAGDYQTYGRSNIFWPFNNGHSVLNSWQDRYTPENTGGKFPRLFLGGDGWPSTASSNSFWLVDRTHLRVKNIQLSYTLPASVIADNFIESLKIYLNVQNAATFTSFPFFDPERQAGNSRGGTSFPNLAIFSAGMNLNF